MYLAGVVIIPFPVPFSNRTEAVRLLSGGTSRVPDHHLKGCKGVGGRSLTCLTLRFSENHSLSAKGTDARVQLPCVKIIRYSARSHIVTAGEAWPRALHNPFCSRSEQRLWAARHWGPDFVH